MLQDPCALALLQSHTAAGHALGSTELLEGKMCLWLGWFRGGESFRYILGAELSEMSVLLALLLSVGFW